MAPSGFRFGPYQVDVCAHELRKHGLRIKLREKSFEILVCLLEHSNDVVTRQQLRHQLWPEDVFVNFDDSLNTAVNRLRDALGEGSRGRRYIETLPRRGYRFIAPVEQVRTATPTLAVLPFENLSHDPDGDFFGDAMADALTTELANVSSLRVISRQSVLHFKGSLRTAPDIARELKVDAIVEGSVLRAGDRIRITAQLVEVAPEHHLWANAYQFDLGDILTTLAQVARAIAGAVQVALTPAELARLRRPRPVNPEAHLSYLRGRLHLGRWTRESTWVALEYFQSAINKDPGHALAYAHMADCYGTLGFWGHMPFQEAYRKAKEAAVHALRLDQHLSTAHWVFGWSSLCSDWDLAAWEAESLRAIQLNPSDERAHQCYSLLLAWTSEDHERAVSAVKHALDLDPLSQQMNAFAAWVYVWVNDFAQATEQARKTLELFPGMLQAYYTLGLAELCQSRHAEAIAAFEKAVAISPDPLSATYLGCALARAGRIEATLSVLDELLQRSEREPVPPRCFVFLYAELGKLDVAFEWLERAYESRDTGLMALRVMPLYERLRADPRYKQMLRRLGIPRQIASVESVHI
ncbi:MAG TPA: winged helix-turn-helix domain-containing protein, partial [Candidatus Angelobacter sp.]|nr:winged helix-turn-helix domain-containing protein [Candidatus Angelobacter sp.]